MCVCACVRGVRCALAGIEGSYGAAPTCARIPSSVNASSSSSFLALSSSCDLSPKFASAVNQTHTSSLFFCDNRFGNQRSMRGMDTTWYVDLSSSNSSVLFNSINNTSSFESSPSFSSVIPVLAPRVLVLTFTLFPAFNKSTDIITIYRGAASHLFHSRFLQQCVRISDMCIAYARLLRVCLCVCCPDMQAATSLLASQRLSAGLQVRAPSPPATVSSLPPIRRQRGRAPLRIISPSSLSAFSPPPYLSTSNLKMHLTPISSCRTCSRMNAPLNFYPRRRRRPHHLRTHAYRSFHSSLLVPLFPSLSTRPLQSCAYSSSSSPSSSSCTDKRSLSDLRACPFVV